MKQCKSLFGLAFVPLILGFLHSAAAQAAIDAACQPLIKSSEARIAKSSWEQTTITGSGSVVIRMAYANGKSYRKMADDTAWGGIPADFNEAEKQMLEQLESGEIQVSDCSISEGKVINGNETLAFRYTIKMQGADAANAVLYIGKDDFLPYAQESDKVNTTYNYGNIVIP